MVRAGVPAGFDAVVANGMAKDPDRRYRTAGELASAARAVLGISSPATAVTIMTGGSAAAPTVVRPFAATGAESPGAGVRSADADGVTVRFGPGVTQPPTTDPPRAPGWTRRPAPRRRGRRNLVSGVVTGLIVAAVIVYLLQSRAGPLAVLEATVAPAADPGRACDVTVDVVGTVRTNGQAGTITYQWSRSDGELTERLTQTVGDGAVTTDVHLLWTLAGRGTYSATATLRIIEPNPVDTAGSFTYACP